MDDRPVSKRTRTRERERLRNLNLDGRRWSSSSNSSKNVFKFYGSCMSPCAGCDTASLDPCEFIFFILSAQVLPREQEHQWMETTK